MKAKLALGSNGQTVLTLIPETDTHTHDFTTLLGVEMGARQHIINCRGFQYMEEQVEFLIQPLPNRD